MVSSPIITWQIEGETMETETEFILGGSKITADGDWGHEIKKHLLLGRKALTNLVQFSSVSQSCLTLCDPMNCSKPGHPVHHQLSEFTQTHVHRVGDTIQPSSPPAFNHTQHQVLFKRVSSLHQMAKVLEFQLQHQSFQRTPRPDLL